MGQSSSVYVDNQSISYSSLANLFTTIGIKTTNTYFTKGAATSTLNANLFKARVIGTGGQTTNAISSNMAADAILSTTATAIYSNTLSLLPSGLVNIRYTITNPALYAWKAGLYTNTLSFNLSNMLAGSLLVKSNVINVTVDPFLKVTATQPVEFTINTLDLYRTAVLAAKTQTLSITGTLNAGIQTKSTGTNFTYSNGYQGGTDPHTPATVIMAQMTTPSVRPAEFLTGTTFKTMSAATGIEVPVGNTSAVTLAYSFSNNILKSNFLNKGTYTLNLSHEIFDAEATGTVTNQPLSSTIVVNVADMAEILVNNQDVNLVFKTAADYKNGVYVDMPAHVTLSATSPYDVFVQSSNSALVNGSNNIPISALQISSGTEMTPMTLKATRQRILGLLPVIDRKMDIRYSISAAEAAKIIGKADGSYTASITYSLIAP